MVEQGERRGDIVGRISVCVGVLTNKTYGEGKEEPEENKTKKVAGGNVT